MKKKILLSLYFFTLLSFVWAQNGNIVVFSEGGERFTAILNGERVNSNPGTNVKVTDLNQPAYKLKVIFEDQRFGEVSKDIVVTAGEETVYMVKLDKKGNYKVAWRTSTPLAQASASPSSQQVYSWSAPAPVDPAPATAPVPAPTTVVVQETVTTTAPATQPTPSNGENVSMSVNTPGFNMSVNMNGSSSQTAPAPTSTTVITTTTTTSSSQPGNQTLAQPPVTQQQPVCMGMEQKAFEGACSSIQSKSFEDSKLTLAKQVASSNCLLSAQVKTVMDLLTFEESKLEFAKHAYANCPDKQNYYQVNDGFKFESTIEDLDKFIQGQR